MITCWRAAAPMIYLLGPGILVRVCSTAFQVREKEEKHGRKVLGWISRSAPGFAGLGRWEGGGEKGLVCNYGPSPRAAGEAVLGKQSHITGCFNPLLPSRLTNCIFLELFAFKIKTLCVKIR